MNIDTQDKLSAQINQARGVLAALLADTCDLKRGSNLSTEMQNNALWAVDSLLAQAQKEVIKAGLTSNPYTEHGGSRQENPL